MGEDLDIEEFFELSRKVSVDVRSIIPNSRTRKKLEKEVVSTKGDTSLMADIIYSVRVSLRHRGVRKININDREWLQVKNLTEIVCKFCEDFSLEYREGFIIYVKMGLSKISSYRNYVGKLISMSESIYSEYECIQELKDDPTPELTKKMHDMYVNRVTSKTGIYENFLDKPSKMYHFYLAKKMCQRLRITEETFMDAQFESLAWCNGLPSPESLTEEKSIARLNKFLYNQGISANISPQEVKFWNKLKDNE